MSEDYQKKLINRLCLGTVQFGLDYGIANNVGKVNINDVNEIIKYAFDMGIDIVDTAYNYGEAECVLGKVLNQYESMRVISKLPNIKSTSFDKGNSVKKCLTESLNRIKKKNLYGYMLHRVEDVFEDHNIWRQLQEEKEDGRIKKIGFSLYYPQHLQEVVSLGFIPDIVQVPYSIFDERFEESFKCLKDKGVEVHVRSVFLQGLPFIEEDKFLGVLAGAKTTVLALKAFTQKFNIPISAVCLCGVLLNKYVDKIVFGVDSLKQLKFNIEMLGYYEQVEKLNHIIKEFIINDEQILLPFQWGK